MSEWDELRALAEAATPGPWRTTTQGGIEAHDYDGPGEVSNSLAQVRSPRNWNYIAAVSPDVVLRLIASAERGVPDGRDGHDLDRMLICRRCGRGITAFEILDGQDQCSGEAEGHQSTEQEPRAAMTWESGEDYESTEQEKL